MSNTTDTAAETKTAQREMIRRAMWEVAARPVTVYVRYNQTRTHSGAELIDVFEGSIDRMSSAQRVATLKHAIRVYWDALRAAGAPFSFQVIVEDDLCGKCEGQGFIPGLERVEGGMCFSCSGSGRVVK